MCSTFPEGNNGSRKCSMCKHLRVQHKTKSPYIYDLISKEKSYCDSVDITPKADNKMICMLRAQYHEHDIVASMLFPVHLIYTRSLNHLVSALWLAWIWCHFNADICFALAYFVKWNGYIWCYRRNDQKWENSVIFQLELFMFRSNMLWWKMFLVGFGSFWNRAKCYSNNCQRTITANPKKSFRLFCGNWLWL